MHVNGGLRVAFKVRGPEGENVLAVLTFSVWLWNSILCMGKFARGRWDSLKEGRAREVGLTECRRRLMYSRIPTLLSRSMP